jgi:NitT/TauT family transport system substrate-binding protein
MQTGQNRRRLLARLSSATAVALIGSEMGSAPEAPPEVTTIRLAKVPGICIAASIRGGRAP